AGRIAGGGGGGIQPGEHPDGVHRRHRLHHQRGGGIPHHRPDLEDVPRPQVNAPRSAPAVLPRLGDPLRHGIARPQPSALGPLRVGVIALEVMLGSLTFTGSLMAAGKLQGLIRGYPITYRGQNFTNLLLLAAILGLIPFLMFVPTSTPAFYTLVGLAFFFGVMLVLPIGAADMPVVIALLNSYAGLTDAAID